MALEGSIRDFSLADIFQLIGIQRKTGVLTLKNKDEEVKVSFLNGMVVNADSRSKRLDDRLGSVLVKTGKLGPEDLKKGLKLQKDTLKKLGHVLVEESLVRPEDLREALNIQITQIIYRLFRWKDGDYHFEQDVSVDYDKENFTPMSAESLLMEGMRMIDEWPIIERKITSFEMVFEKVPLEDGAEPTYQEGGARPEGAGGGDDFDLIFGGEKKGDAPEEGASKQIRLTREENLVYQQVNGKATVQELIERTMMPEFDTCRALYDLMNRNLIQPVATSRARTPGAARPRAVDTGRYLAPVLYAGLVLALVVAATQWRRNPLNVLVPPPGGPAAVRTLEGELASLRVRRVADAIDVYRLVTGEWPAGADALRGLGLLRDSDLVDPWGRPIGFEAGPDRIVVSGRTGPGDDAPVVTAERHRG